MTKVSKLIIFLVPPEKIVNGGVMSIFSLCKETRGLRSVHGSEVVVCTYIGYPTYATNDLFANKEHVYDFDEIINKFPDIKELVIHVPELAIQKLYTGLEKYESYISTLLALHINILNQNIRYMPEYFHIGRLYKFTKNITQTTAHDKYSTQDFSDRFGLPLKHLSVFIDKNQYIFKTFSQKRPLISYSPDKHPYKQKVLDTIAEANPEFELREIKNISYEEYKKTISESKFVITFGEGFDGYFIESAFSGSVPIAVYNEDFFPANFRQLPTVYDSYESLIKNIGNDLTNLSSSQDDYLLTNKKLSKMLEKLYGSEIYRTKLKAFYEGSYDFLPRVDAYPGLLSAEVISYEQRLDESKTIMKSLESEVKRSNEQVVKLERQLNELISSKSWKVTKPLRLLLSTVKRLK